jgi:hypothetical protein
MAVHLSFGTRTSGDDFDLKPHPPPSVFTCGYCSEKLLKDLENHQRIHSESTD